MRILEVMKLVQRGHAGQTRKDGKTPYVNHPVDVCLKLNELGFTARPLSAMEEYDEVDFGLYAVALCHDLLEDTNISGQEINDTTNNYIYRCVEQLTCRKSDANPFYKASYLNEIVKSDSPFVFAVKCADRICNVNDFIKAGNVSYAKIYFHKADILWTALFERRKGGAYRQMWEEVVALNNKLEELSRKVKK